MRSSFLPRGRCVSPPDTPEDREGFDNGDGRSLRRLAGDSNQPFVTLGTPTKPVVARCRSSSQVNAKARSIKRPVTLGSASSITPMAEWHRDWSRSFLTPPHFNRLNRLNINTIEEIKQETKVEECTLTPSLDDLFPLNDELCPTHAAESSEPLAQDAELSARRKKKIVHLPSPPTSPVPYPTPDPTTSSAPSSSPVCLSPDPAFTLADFGEKGTGLRALQTIERGSRITSEPPFIRFTHPITPSSIRIAWDRLSDRNKQRFLGFTPTIPDIEDRFVNIAETNAVPLCVPSRGDAESDEEHAAAQDGMSGMFKTICRVNHSCEPNACWTWSARRQKLTLRAIRDIPAGSEVTASYIDDLTLARDDRQKMLFDNFGFTCRCGACGKSVEEVHESDQNLARYRELRSRISIATEALYESPGRGGHVFTILGDVQDAMNILDDENRIEAKGELRMQMVYLHAYTGNRAATVRAAKVALRHFKATIGKEGVRRTELEEWIRHPELVPFWRSH